MSDIKNKCGECTLCCEILHIEEENFKKPSNITCEHCIINKGCKIYNERPESCRIFRCAYYQMDNVNILLRPDKCGVVFEKLDNDLMFGTVNTKHKDLKYIKGQINSFLKEKINVVLSINGQLTTYHLDDVNPETLFERIFKFKND